MSAFKDLTGLTFEYLTVISCSDSREPSSGSVVWKCECKCKSIVYVPSRSLNSGGCTSCGCKKAEYAKKLGKNNKTHGSAFSYNKGGVQLDYALWSGMKRRCYNKNNKYYSRYGGRGIKVCKQWKESFGEFAKYIRTLGGCPSNKMLISRGKGRRLKTTLDRIDNNKDYKPGNIKWSTRKEQANNRSNNLTVIYKGKPTTLSECCEKYAVVSYQTVHQRIKRDGWSLEHALFTPSRQKPK